MPEHNNFSIRSSREEQAVITCPAAMTVNTAADLLSELRDNLQLPAATHIRLDLGPVEDFDDYGVLVLEEFESRCQKANIEYSLINMPANVQELLSTVGFFGTKKNSATEASKLRINVLTHLGKVYLNHLVQVKSMISFSGDILLCAGYLLLHPGKLRRKDLIVNIQNVGVAALPVVSLIGFLLGLIIAFMSSVQLEQFGANIYVASLLSLAMFRELGPIMTAILIAGRSGSAFAAEISSMKISEEVDALITMGFDTTIFLAMPKILATLITLPILVLVNNIFALGGGLVIGVGMMNLTINSYVQQVIETISLFDFSWGLLKSAIFALLVAGIGCYRGFQVRGGAAEVGQATTSAVVSAIFLIIIADSILAVLLRYW